MKVLRIPLLNCAGEIFQRLQMSRENGAHRWLGRWRRGRQVGVGPQLLGAWPEVILWRPSRGWTRSLERLTWGNIGAAESGLDPRKWVLALRLDGKGTQSWSSGGRSLIVFPSVPPVAISLRVRKLIPTITQCRHQVLTFLCLSSHTLTFLYYGPL